MDEDQWLFAYGTLRQGNVQSALFGREIETCDDALRGFKLAEIAIDDPVVIATSDRALHPIIIPGAQADVVAGAALRLTDAELAKADRYEVDAYVRVPVILESGRPAFAYVQRDGISPLADVAFVTPDAAISARLLPVARRIFTDTFSALYDRVQFEAFCDAAYLPGGTMDRDLQAPEVRWCVPIVGGSPIGYAKLTPLRAPAADPAAGAMELQQLYILSAWHGTGVADQLVDWAVATATAAGAPELYLTVFDHNERAKRFYTRHCFVDVGHCTFTLGDRTDDDRIWRRRLTSG